mmetsp:Transcript_11439/g.28428  ORF Transcript_11439/g.28428 Transcript_11439/m.28428 type:complete len:248 (+) Transcript_11439:3357-4100(+)
MVSLVISSSRDTSRWYDMFSLETHASTFLIPPSANLSRESSDIPPFHAANNASFWLAVSPLLRNLNLPLQRPASKTTKAKNKSFTMNAWEQSWSSVWTAAPLPPSGCDEIIFHSLLDCKTLTAMWLNRSEATQSLSARRDFLAKEVMCRRTLATDEADLSEEERQVRCSRCSPVLGNSSLYSSTTWPEVLVIIVSSEPKSTDGGSGATLPTDLRDRDESSPRNGNAPSLWKDIRLSIDLLLPSIDLE